MAVLQQEFSRAEAGSIQVADYDRADRHRSCTSARRAATVGVTAGVSDMDGATSREGTQLPPEQADEFVRAEHPWLVRYFRGRTHNPHDAHDLAQETILQFLRTAQTNAIRAPQHLLRKIASNIVGKHAERGSNRISRNSVPLIELFDRPTEITPAREAEGKEELGHWVEVINRLKPRTRDIFLMSRVDGYSYEEIAGHYRMTVWGVKKHMIKAIAHIDRNRRIR